jgi:DNA polymerase
MPTISIDFETRSTIDLRKTGVYPYAAHPTTDVWCMAWAVGDDEPELWVPDTPLPVTILRLLKDGARMRAWNAQFERVIWNEIMVDRYDFPPVGPHRWDDTAAEAAAMALPRNLAHAAQVLGIEEQKDTEGHSLMLRMSKPRSTKGGDIVWWDVPERLARLYEYCKQDVRTEQAIAKAVRRLGGNEYGVYLLDQIINDRGILLDVPLIKKSIKVVEQGLEQANQLIRDATGGEVKGVTRTADLRKWLSGQLGYPVDSVARSVVSDLLAGELPSEARMVLEARAEAGRSSVAKLKSMLEVRGTDNRVRGLLFYHGAKTGRWTSKLLQVHNFPRGEVPDPEYFIDYIMNGDYEAIDAFHPPLMVVSALLRGMLRAAPDHRLMVGDFAQIEARVLAWLAGQDDLVYAFATGAKVYEEAAARFGGTRQHGKAQILGCGYGMGWKKFIEAAKAMFGLVLDKELAQTIVDDYRTKNTAVVQLWRDIDNAAYEAVRMPGSTITVRGCTFTMRGAYLWLVLPSGRPLAYAKPVIRPRETPWGEVRDTVLAWGVNSQTRKWERRALYGGLLVENIVQALSRDIMAGAMLRLENRGYPVILTVHDEVVCEVPNEHGTLSHFDSLMAETPEWAEGCPVAVECFEAERYRKE